MTTSDQLTAVLQAVTYTARSRDTLTAAREEYLRGNEADAFRMLREATAEIDAAEAIIRGAGLETVCAEMLLAIGMTRMLCGVMLGARGGETEVTNCN